MTGETEYDSIGGVTHIFHTNTYMHSGSYFHSLGSKKTLAKILLVTLISTLILPGWVAAATGFSYYSDILRAANVIDRDFSSATPITRADAMRIAVGIGGWDTGCSASSTVTCDIEATARTRGLVTSGLGNMNLGIIIRANAIRLVLQARGIAPSSNPSGFSDVDGKMSATYTSYIAKAREIGCIQGTTLFRPFDATTEGEFAKMAVCSIESGTGSTTFSSAPQIPVNPPINTQPGSTPSVVYYGGGGGGSTTIVNNYTSSGLVENFTATGIANFNLANFSGAVNFSTLPSLPLSYGSFYIGNSGSKASEFSTGSA
jgi:hypothetical protein